MKLNITKHAQLIATGLSGLLIILAYVLPNLSIPLFICAFIIGGFAKAKEGLEDLLLNRRLNVELLMIFAAIGAGLIGHWAEGAILIFIFALSGALETYTMHKSERDLSQLMQLQPEQATRIEGDQQEVVHVQELCIGDQVWVKPGERIPIDGKLVQGMSTINESAITGESIPVTKERGEELFAGTMNESGAIVLQVTKLSRDTLFQKIVHLVHEAQEQKSPSQQFIERFETRYVKVVLIVVALMFFVPHYTLGWSWQETWYRALVLLVVASPCALVASISPAVLSVLSYGARNGVLIKGGSPMERLSAVQAVALDKTGTITTGKPKVVDVKVHPDMDETDFLQKVAGLECQSTHPSAKAIVSYVEQAGITYTPCAWMQDVPGKGVYGEQDGQRWSIGNARFMGEEEARQFLQTMHIEEALMRGKSVLFAGDETGIAGMIMVQDHVRDEVRPAIRELQHQGMHITMLTGDQHTVAASVAAEVGIDDYQSEVLPDDKMSMVKALREKHGSIVMIGDGINDAPSLATADVGVAMGAGTDIALDTADMVLVKNNLHKISETILLSKKMKRIIKQNIVFSLAVIGVLILANFFQVLSLPLGVIGHEGSTILVILNGLRLLRGL